MDGPAPESVLDSTTLDEQSQRLRALARALVGDAAADDLVQRTWLEALKSKTFAALGAVDRGPYLRGIARRLAANERRQSARRLRRESEVARPEPLTGLGIDPRATTEQIELLEVLLTNLKELPEPYRTALRLRYLEQLSAREIGERTNSTEGAVRVRVHRGLALLREQMDASHGGRRSQWFLPLAEFAGWKSRVTAAAALPLGPWVWLFGAAALLAIPGALLLSGDRADDLPHRTALTDLAGDTAPPAPTTRTVAPPPVERTAVPTVVAETPAPVAVASVRALRMPSGTPLVGADVNLREADGTPQKPFDFHAETDADGRAWFPDASPMAPRFELLVRAPGYADVVGNAAPDLTLAGDVTVELWPLSSYGGRVVDSDGQPVEGAQVEIRSRWERRDRSRFVHGPEKLRVVSDAAGLFELEGVADGPRPPRLSVLHPEMVPREFIDLTAQTDLRAGLLAGTGEIVLAPAEGPIEVRVVDRRGQPVAGATLAPARPVGRSESWSMVADEAGRARLALGPLDLTQLIVTAPGRGPTQFLVTAGGDGDGALDLVTCERTGLRGRVVDSAGAPIVGATVEVVGLPLRLADGSLLSGISTVDDARMAIDGDGRSMTVALGARATPDGAAPADLDWLLCAPIVALETDAGGRFEWSDAPSGPALFKVSAKGYGAVGQLPLEGGAEVTIELDAARTFELRLSAADGSDLPTDVRYSIEFGREQTDGSVDVVGRFGTAVDPGGTTDVLLRYTCDAVRMSVHGKGYVTDFSPWLGVDELIADGRSVVLDSHTPGLITVLSSEGVPIAGAEAVAGRPTARARLEDGLLTPHVDVPLWRTDGQGRIEVGRPPVQTVLVVSHPEGVALLTDDWDNHHELRLAPWSAVEIDAGPAFAGATVELAARRSTRAVESVEGLGGYVPGGLLASNRAVLDADGRAAFEQVLPAATHLTVRKPDSPEPDFALLFMAEPGQRRQVTPPAGAR